MLSEKKFRLVDYLSRQFNISDIDLSFLKRYEHRVFKKGEYLLRPGEKCRHTFFVEAGLLRQFGVDEKGREHTLQFAPEDWWVTDRESVLFNQETKYFIQALEESEVLALDQVFFSTLSEISDSFGEFNSRLLHKHIQQLNERIYHLLSATAEERYLNFIHVYPDILQRVPQHLVASYLGLHPESLSRVRKELAHRSERHS